MPPEPFRCGYAAIVGSPNAGKSTLLNALLREHISIVSPKPQTTRTRVIGLLTMLNTQIIFVDTPGILDPKYALQAHMLKGAKRAFRDADVVLLVIDGAVAGDAAANVVSLMLSRRSGVPLLVAINKIDTIGLSAVAEKESRLKHIFRPTEVHRISALQRIGLEGLTDSIARLLPVHPPLYPDDIISEHPERFFAAEFVRETLFDMLHDELPYSSAVEVAEFKDREKGKTYINAAIVVERDSQKRIVIGAKGSMLKRIGAESRRRIESFLGRSVYLDLFVAVRREWRSNETQLKRFGYGEEEA